MATNYFKACTRRHLISVAAALSSWRRPSSHYVDTGIYSLFVSRAHYVSWRKCSLAVSRHRNWVNATRCKIEAASLCSKFTSQRSEIWSGREKDSHHPPLYEESACMLYLLENAKPHHRLARALMIGPRDSQLYTWGVFRPNKRNPLDRIKTMSLSCFLWRWFHENLKIQIDVLTERG